jgi:hypothetical protein
MFAKLFGSYKLKQLDVTSIVLIDNLDLTTTYETLINIGTPYQQSNHTLLNTGVNFNSIASLTCEMCTNAFFNSTISSSYSKAGPN